MGRRDTDKRDRLVQAAVKLFHRDGVQATSIAGIASEADVPVGNVFYYFRTKEALIRAVVDSWIERIDSALESLAPDDPPKRRLEAFLDLAADRADTYASAGCPLVALARDVRQSNGALAPLARKLVERQTDWIGRMYHATGFNVPDAQRRARCLLATLQGSFQLAFASGDSDVIVESVAILKGGLAEQGC